MNKIGKFVRKKNIHNNNNDVNINENDIIGRLQCEHQLIYEIIKKFKKIIFDNPTSIKSNQIINNINSILKIIIRIETVDLKYQEIKKIEMLFEDFHQIQIELLDHIEKKICRYLKLNQIVYFKTDDLQNNILKLNIINLIHLLEEYKQFLFEIICDLKR